MVKQTSQGLLTLSAVAGAAVVLQGSSAVAMPSPMPSVPEQDRLPQGSWTVAQELPKVPVVSSTSALGQPINTLGLTANWSARIAQPEQSAGCCFSTAAASSTWTLATVQSDQNDAEIYLLLGLTLWFGATAPWILRRFWLSQQQFAYGRPQGRRRAHHHRGARRHPVRQPVHQGMRQGVQRSTTSLYYGSYAGHRFAKPRARSVQDYPLPRHWQKPVVPQPVQITVETAPVSHPDTCKALPALQPA